MILLERPQLLALAVPLALLTVYAHFRLHGRLLPSLIRLENPMLKVAGGRGSGGRRLATLLLKLLLVALLSAALASPYVRVERVVERSVEAEVTDVLQVARPAAVVVIDVSGSMADRIPGGVKIEAAKSAVRRFLRGVPANVSLGLIAFDHEVVLAVPVTRNVEILERELERLQPRGGTMYTYPLQTALSMLRPYRALNASCAVIFVSDGLPADRGLYDGVLREMRALNVSVHTVYVGPGNDPGAAEMRRIAELTGGRSYSVETAQELAEVLGELARTVSSMAAGYRARVTYRERVEERVDLSWALLSASTAALAALLYARYRRLGVAI